MRTAQAHHLRALGQPEDFLGVAATGSGKSLGLFIEAAADALAARRRGGAAVLGKVRLVVVPFANIGTTHEAAGNHSCTTSHTPMHLGGRRSGTSLASSTSSAGAMATAGATAKVTAAAPTPPRRAGTGWSVTRDMP